MPKADSPSSNSRRKYLFRFGAIALGLLPLALLELVLFLGGWEKPDFDDPFVAYKAVRPLFSLNDKGDRYEIAESRRDWFYPVSFAAEKKKETYRIFCIGASTTAGRPFTVETAYSTWLKLSLDAADPSRDWEVINCGGVSYASYRLLPIFEEIIQYDPDLIVIYTGQNEFLEDRTYEHLKDIPDSVVQGYQVASNFRTFNVLREAYLGLSEDPVHQAYENRPVMAEDVDALLEHKGGMEHYFRDPDWQASVIEHYRFNVNRMIELAQEADVPAVLINPVSNIRHQPPFKSQHRDGLTQEDHQRFDQLLDTAQKLYGTDEAKALDLLSEALEIDDLYALLHYEMAHMMLVVDRIEEARKHFILAKDLDVCPLRILEPMHVALNEVATTTNTPIVDARAAIEAESPYGVPGSEWMLDHVHPTIKGHGLIADLILQQMVAMRILEPRPGWERIADQLFTQHEQTLPESYYTEAEWRLENLRQWALGRSHAEPPIEYTRRNPRREE